MALPLGRSKETQSIELERNFSLETNMRSAHTFIIFNCNDKSMLPFHYLFNLFHKSFSMQAFPSYLCTLCPTTHWVSYVQVPITPINCDKIWRLVYQNLWSSINILFSIDMRIIRLFLLLLLLCSANNIPLRYTQIFTKDEY